MNSIDPPAFTGRIIQIITKLKGICEGILTEYQEYEKLYSEGEKIERLISQKNEDIVTLSTEIVDAFDDDALKALYDLSRKNRELYKLEDDLRLVVDKCKEQRKKTDSKYQWAFGEIFDKLTRDQYLICSDNDPMYYLPIFGDSQPS